MARKKRDPVESESARAIGGLLRGLRKVAGYRAVKDAAAAPRCPAAQQTIYAYERGGLLPSLPLFLDLVEFYAGADGAHPETRSMAVAAVFAALASPAYHVPQALDLMRRLQPPGDPGRERRRSGTR
jgi:DNA-binding XRE family transcriptional regulator